MPSRLVGCMGSVMPVCPLAADQPFPNLDNLSDYITAYYAATNSGGC